LPIVPDFGPELLRLRGLCGLCTGIFAVRGEKTLLREVCRDWMTGASRSASRRRHVSSVDPVIHTFDQSAGRAQSSPALFRVRWLPLAPLAPNRESGRFWSL